MKKLIVVLLPVLMLAGCAGTPPPADPESGPELIVVLPELFTPNPQVANDSMTVSITVNHPVEIRDWNIRIQPIRRGRGPQPPEAEDERRIFFEASGTGRPPAQWRWNGRSSSPGNEMAQSATEYRFTLSVNDVHGNNSTYEGSFNIGIIVLRDGNVYRIAVPSLVFPGNSADLAAVEEEYRRSNSRVLWSIANSLYMFPDYRITVEGHANPTFPAGTAARANEERVIQPISEARARAVVDYLVANYNIPRARFTVVGMGGRRTVANHTDDEVNWKNRRVEFILNR